LCLALLLLAGCAHPGSRVEQAPSSVWALHRAHGGGETPLIASITPNWEISLDCQDIVHLLVDRNRAGYEIVRRATTADIVIDNQRWPSQVQAGQSRGGALNVVLVLKDGDRAAFTKRFREGGVLGLDFGNFIPTTLLEGSARAWEDLQQACRA
jgi:hypothetical protein